MLVAAVAVASVATERAPITDLALLGPVAMAMVWRGAREGEWTSSAALQHAAAGALRAVAPSAHATSATGVDSDPLLTSSSIFAARALLRLVDLAAAFAAIAWLLRCLFARTRRRSDAGNDAAAHDTSSLAARVRDAALRVARDAWIALLYARESFVFLGLAAKLGSRWRWMQAATLLIVYTIALLKQPPRQ